MKPFLASWEALVPAVSAAHGVAAHHGRNGCGVNEARGLLNVTTAGSPQEQDLHAARRLGSTGRMGIGASMRISGGHQGFCGKGHRSVRPPTVWT